MYDVIIIGAGITGVSIARELSKYEGKILLLEKNLEACQETSKANSAIAHGGYDCQPGSLKAKLNVWGLDLLKDLSEDLEFTFKQIGSMVLAFDENEILKLEELLEKGRKNGVKNLRIIDREEILQIEKRVSGEVKKALYCPQAGIVDPFNYCYAQLENAIENGLNFKTECRVTGLNKLEDKIEVITDKGTYLSKYVVNAAGLYSDRIAFMAGDKDFRIMPTKGSYKLLDKTKGQELSVVLFQTPTEKGKGVLVTPTYDGNLMVGPTSERTKDPEDTRADQESFKIIESLGKKSVPDVDFSKTIRVFTGVRAKPDTGDFMIYLSRKMPGLIHAGGIESPGLVSAPAVAKYVLELLVKEGMDLVEKKDFVSKRQAIKRVNTMTSEEIKEAIKNNPAYGKIICRCETVSEAEIVESIRRPGGAVTVDGVKRRVRAGMGRCQGGFCGPRVLEILARELDVDPLEVKKELAASNIVMSHLKENKESFDVSGEELKGIFHEGDSR